MRAARVTELGKPPEPAEIEGGGSIEIVAVALNPLDLSVAAGRFYGGHPPLPYVPGSEAVGRRDGQRVYLFGEGRGTAKDGFLAERVDFPRDLAIPIPEEIDDAVAVAAGIAGLAGFIPVTRVARVSAGDRVLVLGGSGTAGSVAVQAAKLAGADRVVAAGRDEAKLARARELGADATVHLGEAYGEEFDVIIDPLWGEPLARALEAAANGARVVHLGQSAGPTATLPSGTVRGKQLRILGHSNFALPRNELRAAYLELLHHLAAGHIRIEIETFTLERINDAWTAQERGAKAVVLL